MEQLHSGLATALEVLSELGRNCENRLSPMTALVRGPHPENCASVNRTPDRARPGLRWSIARETTNSRLNRKTGALNDQTSFAMDEQRGNGNGPPEQGQGCTARHYTISPYRK